MSPKTLLSALLCATACIVVQAAEVTTFDLGQVDTSYFSATGSGQTVRLLNGDTVPNATYEYLLWEEGDEKTPVDVRHLVVTGDVTLTGSTTAFGVMAGADVTITLADATIQPAGYYTAGSGGLLVETLCTGAHAVTLVLADGTTNKLTGSTSSYRKQVAVHAGLTVPAGGSLTIQGMGKLMATAGATSSLGAAGIGANLNSRHTGLSNITIEGGLIEATGTLYGAGIGDAYSSRSTGSSTIAISGGTILATGGSCGAGIGGGAYQKVPAVTITGGTVTATGGAYASGIGAGLGYAATGYNTTGGTVTISGGTIKATGGYHAAAIGGAQSTDGGTVAITGGTVKAQAGTGSPYAIGSGYDATGTLSAGTLTVGESATVDTRGGNTPEGILGAIIIDLATQTATPDGSVTVSENTITVANADKAVILKGTGSEVTLALPAGVELVFPEGEGYAASLKAMTCSGDFQVEGCNALTVGTVTGTMTLTQRAGTVGMTLKVTEACAGKVNVVGTNAVTLPAETNLGTYTAAASITTADSKFPLAYAAAEEIPSPFDVTGLTANATFPETSGWSVTAESGWSTLTVPAGVTLTGSAENLAVKAAGDITLSNLALNAKGQAAPLTMTADGTVTLAGDNQLVGAGLRGGVEAPEGVSVIVEGSGNLTASSSSGAAIGGAQEEACGKITLRGTGTLVATSASGAAIGGGYGAKAEAITVESGTVVAIGYEGAGIGLGARAAVGESATAITISGGKVLAYASSGAAIGTGTETWKVDKAAANIAISGGTIIATANTKPAQATVVAKLAVSEAQAAEWLDLMTVTTIASGAGIGGGSNGSFGTIAITGGDITAASVGGAAIGGGHYYANTTQEGTSSAGLAAADSITISGAGTTITATSERAAAIGAGTSVANGVNIGSITIDGDATVTATTNGATASAIGGTGKTGVSTITIGSAEGGNKVAADSVGNGTASTTESVITIHLSDTAVARIGTVGYESIGEAIIAAKAGDTLTVLKDCNLVWGIGEAEARVETTFGLTITKALTLDGAGHTLTLPVEDAASDYDQGYLLLAADVTFKDVQVASSLAHPVRVSGYNWEAEDYAWVLTVEGENAITGGIGVYSEDDGTLKIVGSGNLVANADGFAGAAGIGGDGAVLTHTCGDIILAGSGAITATAGKNAAGLGGGGDTASGTPRAQTGSVTICSGTVKAYGDDTGAAIGSGTNYNLGSITITGGDVLAEPKAFAVESVRYSSDFSGVTGAGIGLYGDRANGTASIDMPISISGGATQVVAKGGFTGCGIGGANGWGVKSITITDATVTAIGQSSSAAIGSGNYAGGGSGVITIGGTAKVIAEATGLTVYVGTTATGAYYVFTASAAIGGGYANRANVTIGGSAKVLAVNAGPGTYAYWGGTYTAVSPTLCNSPTGAAIGSGRIPCYPTYTSVAAGAYPDQVVITGSAQVWAYGGQGGAGIGGGHDSWAQNGIQYGTPMNFPDITLSGSAQVVAVGGTGASAIGGGHHAQNGGQITIASTATITATAGAAAEGGTVPAAIGTGSYNAAWSYCPSQGNSGAATVAAGQPTTTLTVEAEGALTVLAIVTKDSAGNATNLSDSPGLAINLKQGETVQSVTQTAGSLTGNAIVAEATQANPVSTVTDAEAGTVTHTLALDGAKVLANAQTEAGSAYLAAVNGDVVARLDTVETELGGTKTTLAVLDPALLLNGSAALVTQNQSKEDRADVAEKAWLLNAALAFSADEASSAALTYAYEFGIEAITAGNVTAEGIPLTSVTIGLKEGSGAAATARSGRLNGTLNLYANGEKVAAYALKSPTFTNGQCTIVPAQAPCLPLAVGEQAIKLTVKLEP